MSTATYTEAQRRAAKDALFIIDPGACNGRGTARALVRAYDAWGDAGTDASNRNPAARLILMQLCNLAQMNDPCPSMEEFGRLLDECKEIAGKEDTP